MWAVTCARPNCAPAAVIEDIDFHRQRGLERSVVLGLAACGWVKAHHNLAIVGPTGAGKTFLGCALANSAVRHGHTALYLRAPRMLDELAIAHADGRFAPPARHLGAHRRPADRRFFP